MDLAWIVEYNDFSKMVKSQDLDKKRVTIKKISKVYIQYKKYILIMYY